MKIVRLLLILLIPILVIHAAELETKVQVAAISEEQSKKDSLLINAVHELLQAPGNNVVQSDGSTVVKVDPAIADPIYASIKSALKQGANITARDTQGNVDDEDTIMHTIFCSSGNPQLKDRVERLVYMLLDLDVIHAKELNVPDKEGFTPFIFAVGTMPISMIETFIKLGAHVNSMDNERQTPLSSVIDEPTDDANIVHDKVKLLLKYGAAVDGGGKDYPICANCNTVHIYNPLHESVQNNNLRVAQTLLDAGAVIYDYVLPCAVQENNVDIVKLLLRYKAPINGVDENGRTALIWAIMKGNEEIAKLLLQAGADVDVMSKKGFTPLILAVRKGNVSLTTLLLQSGADINKSDAHGKFPLMYAAEGGHKNIVTLLLQHGANPSFIDKDGHDAEWYAVNKAPAGIEAKNIRALLIQAKKEYNALIAKRIAEVEHPLFAPGVNEFIGEFISGDLPKNAVPESEPDEE